MNRSIKIKCKQPCTVHFWSDDDLGDITSDELTSGDDETLKSDNKNKYYRFDESKKFNFFLNNVNTLKYKTSEEETEHEYKKPEKPVVMQKMPSSKPSNTKPINLVKSAFNNLQQPVAGDKCGRIFNFRNRGLTCHLDSLLFALFALQKMEDYIPRTIFNINGDFNSKDLTKTISEQLKLFLYNNYVRLTEPTSVKKGNKSDMCELAPEPVQKYLFGHEGQDRMAHDAEVLRKILDGLKIKPLSNIEKKIYINKKVEVYETGPKPTFICPIIKLGHIENEIWRVEETKFITTVESDISPTEYAKMVLHQRAANGSEIKFDKLIDSIEYTITDLEFLVFQNTGSGYIINEHLGKQHSRAEIILNENSVIPNIEAMVKRVNPRLKLNKITCKSGGERTGHFICYFRCNTNWYVYDDMGGGTIKILKTGLLIDPSFKWSLLFFDITNPTI